MQFSFSRNVRRKFQLEKNMATYDRSFN